MKRATMNRMMRCVAACLILMVGCTATVFAEDIAGATAPPQDLSSAVLAPDVQEIGQEEQTATQSPEIIETATPVAVEATPVPIHRVTFYDLYGNEYAWADVPDGNHVIEPDKPVMPGYDFKYWYDETSELHEPYPFGDSVTRDINLWPLLTVAATQQEVLPDMDGGTEATGEKTPEELAQEIIHIPSIETEQGETEPTLSPPAEVMSEEEADQLVHDILGTPAPAEETTDDTIESAQDILTTQAPVETAEPESETVQDILSTSVPDAVTPSPGPTANGEGTIANILGGVIPSPDETEQPIDGRAKIAEIASGQGGVIAAAETPAAEETLAPNIQYTIDLIEAILQNPAKEAEASAPPEEASTPEAVVESTPDVGNAVESSAQPDVTDAGTASPAPSSETSAEPTAPGEEITIPSQTDTSEVTSSPAPLVEATEVVSATKGAEPTPTPQILEPTSPPEEASTVSTEEEAQPLETDAPPSPQDAPAVIITSESDDEVVGIGSTITLTSQVTGVPDGTMLVYQWQNDASGAYENVPGATSSTYTYVVDEETNNCDWRVQVQVIME